ncbi:unnamed protein product [Prunus armeniaca]|uniref:Uncharacterized protein n=1 Tax=Prunus armeniaca TaxID=36596 RepID=A0A6J5VB19_PRUAR|nr:unnamed protein product [Prunus armeniaca]CAB4293926.1 unnamed protein product [Prunus armeniaca]
MVSSSFCAASATTLKARPCLVSVNEGGRNFCFLTLCSRRQHTGFAASEPGTCDSEASLSPYPMTPDKNQTSHSQVPLLAQLHLLFFLFQPLRCQAAFKVQ